MRVFRVWSAFVALALRADAGVAGFPSVGLAQGTVIGRYDGSNGSVFLGIPYAATTAGENR